MINSLGYDVIITKGGKFIDTSKLILSRLSVDILYPMGSDTFERLTKADRNTMVKLALLYNHRIRYYVVNRMNISSTYIRQLLKDGDIEVAKKVTPMEIHKLLEQMI